MCEILNESNNEIPWKGQNKLFIGEVKEQDLKPIILVFDEIGALTNFMSKSIKKKNFFKLLNENSNTKASI